MNTTVNDCCVIEIPKIEDKRGNLSFVEKDLLPYNFKRVYYLYDVPGGAYRGGHAHKEQQAFLIALSGSFNVVLVDQDGGKKKVFLNKPNQGLLISNMIWRELEDFSSGAVCLVLASDVYNEKDYIRSFDNFKTHML
ncbi:FdtA/QdtA family cupin domain-containing protein [Tamlana agarivorans]|uniref:FdtA/QdtA family cupin domain-containing protein n=1 Tax=Pseudotamlana agarivorans TaxID=481183 RepID=A0ACC5U7A0_9FLAO|nr:FdtA/QdtA family cupin domain-containing protein [Tamlana agarivorans]MBU2950186.1 FdtA/QdtA family cupin domain-containing protein [Tamlana agarivorans]